MHAETDTYLMQIWLWIYAGLLNTKQTTPGWNESIQKYFRAMYLHLSIVPVTLCNVVNCNWWNKDAGDTKRNIANDILKRQNNWNLMWLIVMDVDIHKLDEMIRFKYLYLCCINCPILEDKDVFYSATDSIEECSLLNQQM